MLAGVVDQVGQRAPDQRRIGGERDAAAARRPACRRPRRPAPAPAARPRPRRAACGATAWNSIRALARSSPTSASISIASRSISSSVRGSSVPLPAARLPADLDQQPDARQRRAQLVRDRSQELALLGQLALQPRRHVVERRRQHRRLVEPEARRCHARLEIAGSQLLRRARQLVERLRDPPRDPPGRRPQRHRRRPEQKDRAQRVGRQPAVPEVRRHRGRNHGEKDCGPEPEEEPPVEVRAVMQPQLPANAVVPARAAPDRFVKDAVPRMTAAETLTVGGPDLPHDPLSGRRIEPSPEAPGAAPPGPSGTAMGRSAVSHGTPPASRAASGDST